ncbi:restriction endonuclease subunit S [Vibrio crassostreae]|uniref:restriction endonuclease subunit S n=1 Tax=Vibrio crassostreae TaxID=246167 RepID=UPI001B31156E|nr:restriction endonuclease subunit S [Vibrio crassostreae]
MRSNYKKLGQFIKEVSVKNKDLSVELLLGVSITKQFIPSIANTVGTDMSKYKVVEHHQFAYGPVTSRNGEKISVALLGEEKCIVSASYTVFEIVDTELLDSEYLMMWFRRSEFDRYARYMSHGTVRELFDWQEMCDVELPVPSIEKQREIVCEYNVVNDRISLNDKFNQKLEETAQAIYKQWFVDFEFSVTNDYADYVGSPQLKGKPYQSSGGELCEGLPLGWRKSNVRDYAKVISGFAFKSAWWTDSGSPVIKIGSFHNNTVNYETLDYVSLSRVEGKDKFSCKSGDIVIAMTGFTMGKIGLIPPLFNKYYLNQRVGKFELGENPNERCAYLYCYLLSREFKEQMDSIGGDSRQANVSGDEIEDFEMLIPDEFTLKKFNDLLLPSFNLIMDKVKQNHHLEMMKNTLLQKVTKA